MPGRSASNGSWQGAPPYSATLPTVLASAPPLVFASQVHEGSLCFEVRYDDRPLAFLCARLVHSAANEGLWSRNERSLPAEL